MPQTRLSTSSNNSRIARVLESQLLSQFASFQESETESLIQGLALIGLDYLLSSNLSNHRTSTSSSPLNITTVLQLSEKTAKDIEESEQQSETGLRKQLTTIKEQLTLLTSKFNAIDESSSTTNGGDYLRQRQVIPKPTGNVKKHLINHTFLTQPSQKKSGSHGNNNTSSTQRKSIRNNNNNNSYTNNDSKDRSNSKSKVHNSSLNMQINTTHDTPSESRKPSSAWRSGNRKTSHHSVNSSWDDNNNNNQHHHSVSLEESANNKQNGAAVRKQSYQSNSYQRSQEGLLPAKKITETTYQRTEPVVVQTKHHLDDQETKEILHPLKAYQSERGYLDMNRESDYTRQYDSCKIEQLQDKQGMHLQIREKGEILHASKSPQVQQYNNGSYERQQKLQHQGQLSQETHINPMQGQQYYQSQQYINPKNTANTSNVQSRKILQTPTAAASIQGHIPQPVDYPVVDFKKPNHNISTNNNNHPHYPRTTPPPPSYNTTRSVLMRQEMNEQKKKQELLLKQKAQRQQQQPTYLRNVTSRIRADVQQSKEANRRADNKEVLFLLRDPACPQTHVFTAKQLEIQEEQQQQQVNSNLLLMQQIDENIDYSNKVINQKQQRRQWNQQDQQEIEQQQYLQQQEQYYLQQQQQDNDQYHQQFANGSQYQRPTAEQYYNAREQQQLQQEEDQEELYDDESSQDDFERATQQGFDSSNNFSRQLNSPAHSFPYKSQYSSQVYTGNPQQLAQQFQQQLISPHKDIVSSSGNMENVREGEELQEEVERQSRNDRQHNIANFQNRNQVEKHRNNNNNNGGEQEVLAQQENESQSVSFIEKSYDYAAPRQHYNQRQQQQPHQESKRNNDSLQQYEEMHNGEQDLQQQQNFHSGASNNAPRDFDRVEKDESSMSSSFAPFETDLDMKLLLQNEGFFQKIFDKEEEGGANAAADFSQTKEF